MAIKISGSTIIDDSRVLINTGNIGVGTTNPTSAVVAGNTSVVHAGIVTANYLYGDGSNLTGTGFDPDAQDNLYAGTCSGNASDADTCYNVAIGHSAAASLNSGDYNIYLGTCSGNNNTDGCYNVSLGCAAGGGGSGCSNNTFLGCRAGYEVTGNSNVILGECAGYIASGSNNVILGKCAGACLRSSAIGNVILGEESGRCACGSANVFLGCSAGKFNTTGTHNVALGSFASLESTSGGCNISIGFRAGAYLGSSSDNVFLGRIAGEGPNSRSSGNNNIGIGCGSGKCLSSGVANVFIGRKTGCTVDTGSRNTFLGICAGGAVSGSSSCNVYIGDCAGYCQAGSNSNLNVAIGRWALHGRGATSAGQCNIAIGLCAGACNDTGVRNIYLGHESGYSIGHCNGNDNIVIGPSAVAPIANGDNQLVIGVGSTNWIVGNSSYNVGIGTTNPTEQLDIAGNVRIRGGITDVYGNVGTAGSVLSSTGSGWQWISAGGDSGISSVADDTNPQLGGDLDLNSSDITGTGNINISGIITANSVPSGSNGMRKITASTSTPSGGSDGDIWIKYTA